MTGTANGRMTRRWSRFTWSTHSASRQGSSKLSHFWSCGYGRHTGGESRREDRHQEDRQLSAAQDEREQGHRQRRGGAEEVSELPLLRRWQAPVSHAGSSEPVAPLEIVVSTECVEHQAECFVT